MNRKKTFASSLAAGAVATSLLLGASWAQAATVIFEPNTRKAIGISDLDVPGFSVPFNVQFLGPTEAFNVYGPFPGDLDFDNIGDSAAAVDAVNAALNGANAETVGEFGIGNGLGTYQVGFATFGEEITQRSILSWFGLRLGEDPNPWERPVADPRFNNPTANLYNADSRLWAEFTPVPVPAAVWLLGSGLVALGVVARRRRLTA